jgi:hypothetical protein
MKFWNIISIVFFYFSILTFCQDYSNITSENKGDSIKSSRDSRSLSMSWGGWATKNEFVPGEISISKQNPFEYEKGDDLGSDRVLQVKGLNHPEGPLVKVPLIRDSGIYKKSSSLHCKDGQERYLVRAFSFDRGRLRVVEAANYLEIRTSGNGESENLAGEVLAVCLKRYPKNVFVWWESRSFHD